MMAAVAETTVARKAVERASGGARVKDLVFRAAPLLRSFAERDVPMAADLVARDVAINRLNREIFRLALEAGADAEVRESAMIMTMVARAFERIGDNAVDGHRVSRRRSS